MKKIFRLFIVITMIFSTFYVMPYQVQATDNVPTIEKRETNLQATILSENIAENDCFSIDLVSLDVPIFPEDSSGNVTVEFKNTATGALKEEMFNYYTYNNQTGVQITGNLTRLDFGDNQEVIISRVIFDSFEYDATKFNDGQGLSFMYNERVYNTQVLGIEFDENNQDIYTENGTYSFIVNVNTLDNGGGYANFKIKDNQGNTRNISANTEKVSDTQIRYYIDIDDNNAAIGEYILENIQVGDRDFNNSDEEFKKLGFDQIKFKVEFGSDDFLAPQVEKIEADFENGTIAAVGGIYTYTITLSNDEDIDLDNSHARIQRYNDGSESFDYYLNLQKIADRKYTITVVCDDKTISGTYCLTSLTLFDKSNNSNSYNIDSKNIISFLVQNDVQNITPIEILNVDTPKNNEDMYLNGDKSYQIKITYNRNLSYSYIEFRDQQGNFYNCIGEIQDDVVTYTIPNSSEIVNGIYSINTIYATNGIDKEFIFQDKYSLDEIGFVKSDDSVAYLKEFSVLNESTRVKSGDKLDFNLKYTNIVNSVSLNFYCPETDKRISFSSGSEGFYETEGILEGYITNIHADGIYYLDSISSYNNDTNNMYIDSDSFLWKKLGLDKISFEVYEGNTDFIAPEITKVIIDDNQNPILSDENSQYVFQFETSEPINISSVGINFHNSELKSFLTKNITLLDNTKNLYQVIISSDSDIYDGDYIINYGFNLSDNAGNQTYISKGYSEETDKLFNLTITTNFGRTPNEKVDITDIEVIKNDSVYNNAGEIVYKVTFSEPILIMSEGYRNSTYNKYSSMTSSKKSDKTKTVWTITTSINEKNLNGKYVLDSIQVTKSDGTSQYFSSYEYGDLFEPLNFYVNCGHTNVKAPKIIKITADSQNLLNYTEPGKAVYYIETDKPTTFSFVSASLVGYDKGIYTYSRDVEDLGNNRYKITFNISNTSYNGNYILSSISLNDEYNNSSNYSVYDNDKGYYYLSGLGFEVSCGISDVKAPSLVRTYADPKNKDIYTSNGKAIYYFEFDEPLKSGSISIKSQNDYESSELYLLGNNTYFAEFNIDDNSITNGKYKFNGLSFSDMSNNSTYYSAGSISDLNNIAFEVNLEIDSTGDSSEDANLELISYENKSAIFDSYGRKLLHTISFNMKVDIIETQFKNPEGNHEYFNLSTELVESGNGVFTYNIYADITAEDQSGYYYADSIFVLDMYGKDWRFELDNIIDFTNNMEFNPFVIDFDTYGDKLEQEKYNEPGVYKFDITTSKKIDNLSIEACFNTYMRPTTYKDIRILSVEDVNRSFVYHCEFDVDDEFSKGTAELSYLSFESPEFSYITTNNDDIRLELYRCNFDVNFSSLLSVASDENNQAIYKNSGTVSYIVDGDVEITRVDLRGINNYKYNQPNKVVKLDDNKTRIDIEIDENFSNDFYTLEEFEYTLDSKQHRWINYDSLPYFRVDNGSDDYTAPKIVSVANIDSKDTYHAQDKKEISFDITFDEKVKEVWIGYYNDSYQCYVPTIEYDDDCIHVSMLVDETFGSDQYNLTELFVTDTAGNTSYFNDTDIRESGMSFDVTNSLDDISGDFAVFVNAKLENGESVSNNVWTNEKVYLDLSLPTENKSTILISEDGKSWKPYNPDDTMESGEKTIYVKVETENGETSNVKAVNIKVDQDAPIGDIIIPQIKNRAAIIQTGYTVVIDASDELSGVKLVEYKLVETGKDESSSTWQVGKTVTVPANFEGNLLVKITDNAGNSTVLTKKLEKIANLDVTLSGNTEDNVRSDKININATFDESDGIKYVGIKKNGNEYVDITSTYQDGYTVTENATYSVLVQTNKGAEIEKSISYQNIGKDPVSLSLSGNLYTSTFYDMLSISINVVSSTDQIKSVTITKGDKVVDITDSYKNGYKIESNGTYLVKVETESGKTAQKNITYNNIVQQSTELKFELNHNADSQYLTEDTVTFMILPKDIVVESLIVKKDENEVGNIVDSYSDGYKVTENGTYKFTITTSDGQTASKSVVYNNIDATIPTLSLNGNLASTAATDLLSIEATADTSGIAMVTIQKGDEEPIDITSTYQDGYIISDNGTYTVTLITNSGKNVSTKITYSILIIPYIKITDSQKTIKPDETFKLTVDTNVEGQLTWTSDNEGVATVDQTGTITAVANGSALITVTTESGLKATYTIQVYDITYQLGDVNRDGVLNALDAQIILQAVINAVEIDDEQRVLADVNKDGEIDALDAQIVLQKIIE